MIRTSIRTAASAVVLATACALSACIDDEAPPLEPSAPQESIVDLTSGHFGFLSPLGSSRHGGVFNDRLSPFVEVCRLATSSVPTPSSTCASVVAWFGMEGGTDAERVKVDRRREMYSVVWDLTGYDLPTGYYRVSVRTALTGQGGTVFGFADVAVAPSRSVAGRMADDDVHPVTNTSTLPIKFRIEEGLLCADSIDCFEGTVGPDGGTFATPAEQAGVLFPVGALSTTRTLVIERLTADDVGYCLPTSQPQYEGCYRYRLDPALLPGETFASEVLVGVCPDPDVIPFEDQLVLQKWDEVDPSTLETLPRREVEFLECGADVFGGLHGGSPFYALAAAGVRLLDAIGSLVLPQPLYAGTKSPYGGGLNDFSRVGWVRPLTLLRVDGTAPTACSGSTVLNDPTVRVKSAITRDPVAGVPVAFEILGNGGSIGSPLTHSNAGGFASTSWLLGDPGAQVLKAHGENPLSGWPQFGGTWYSVRFNVTSEDCVD